MPPSKAQQAETATRRAQLIKLRRAGVRFEDPRILGLGYASRGAASKDFKRALEERRDEQAAEASVYRQEENERLDALLEAVWPKATQPTPILDKEGEVLGEEIDLRAVETVLKLMDRRAKLMGIDMPIRTELSGPDGGAVPFASGSLTELDQLIKAAGQVGPDEATDRTDDDSRG